MYNIYDSVLTPVSESVIVCQMLGPLSYLPFIDIFVT